jgi:hypothetical protein
LDGEEKLGPLSILLKCKIPVMMTFRMNEHLLNTQTLKDARKIVKFISVSIAEAERPTA